MPKKTATSNRVELAASSSSRAAKDVAILREAVRNNELTEEERVLYSFLSPAFQSEEVQKSTRKPKKETAIPSESFEPVEDGNDSQFAASTTN